MVFRTKLSFETYGAILAREWLLSTAEGEPSQDLRDLADSVAEAIARSDHSHDRQSSLD